MIRTYIVDDHTLFCEGLEKILLQSGFFQVLRTFYNGYTLLESLHEWDVDLLILDIEMPGMNGLDVIQRIKLYDPTVKIAVLSMHDEKAYIQEAYSLGTDVYLNKSVKSGLLIECLIAICEGKRVLPKINLFEKQDSLLSKREKEILKLIAKGKTSYKIAEALSISQLTVKAHRRNMMRKLKATNTSEMIIKAIEKGFV